MAVGVVVVVAAEMVETVATVAVAAAERHQEVVVKAVLADVVAKVLRLEKVVMEEPAEMAVVQSCF